MKKKGSLNTPSINEAQTLWDEFCTFFGFKNKGPQLFEAIQESNKKIYFDKRVKRLITEKTNDDMVFGEQILAHDILVLCFVLNTQRQLKTNTPEKNWAKLLETVKISKELREIYDNVMVLQTITNDPQQVAKLVQKNLPLFNKEPLSSCVLDFGKLWKFGPQNNYLLTINRENEENANRFLGYTFAYIITLFSKIEQHYLLAVKLYDDISKQEELINELENNLEKLIITNDLPLLEKKRDDIRAIGKETTNNLAYLKDCGNNIQSNLINLKDVVKDLCIVEIEDNIISNNLELFEEHGQNINSWVKVCESALMRINKTTGDLQTTLNEHIDKLSAIADAKEIPSTIPATSMSEEQIPLEWGNSYILNENELEKSLNIFEQILRLDNFGLCITRTHPDNLEKDQKLENTTIYWLSSTSCDFCLSPSLAKITHVITQFFKTHEKSVLLLDGLEYLITNNEFNKVLKLIDNLKELVSLYKSTLLLPLSFTVFSEKELMLIKKNMIDLTKLKVNFEKLNT